MKNLFFTLQLNLVIIFVSYSYETCSFTQFCKNENDPSTCELPKALTYEPFPYNSSYAVCHDFVKNLTCCNQGQNLLMSKYD